MNPDKKISFGFNKSQKKSVVIHNKSEERKVELVECLEDQSIKIKDAIQVVNEPLVIPIKDNKKNLLDRVKAAKAKQDVLIKNNLKEEEDTRPDSELTIEELAARELINDAKNHQSNKSSNKIFVLPIKEDKITLDGEKEPTLDDYESVPVTDYGMAMLRGMGWKEGMGIGKNPTKSAATYEPELRPKGLGLGASKMIKADISKETVCDKDGNALILKRGTCAKIIAGSHKGNYCEVQGLDDEAGTVIVKTSLKGEILTLNEFLIVPVTKEEYSKGSKVLNNAKYEEYKEISDKKLENHWKGKRETTSNLFKEEAPENISSSRKLKDIQGSQDDKEQSTRSSSYNKKYLASDEENERYERKKYINESKNEKYDKDDKYGKATYKDKYENRSRSNRDRKKDSSDSDSDNENKNRKDKERKSYYGESSKSHEDRYRNNKKSSKSKHRSRSSSSDNNKRDINKRNKSKSGHHKHDSSERDRLYRKTRK